MTLKATRRAIYPYTCLGCRKRRKTFRYARALRQTCTVCERSRQPANQPTLFPVATLPSKEAITQQQA